jgi:hypothetical protein
MSTIAVEVRRVGEAFSKSSLEEDLVRVRRLATLLDSQFEIAGIKFGLDAIAGLVPVLGDLATAVVGTYPLLIAHKHGLGKFVRARMVTNLLVDWAVGSIPLVGDVFDVAFKAHKKNAHLLERAAEKHRQRVGSSSSS